MTWKPDICIYHAGCTDGFAAAWAVHQRWGGGDLQYVPAAYGDAPPDVTGKRVLIVDFSYKRPVIEQLSASASQIVILDHHKSAEVDLGGFNHIIGGSFQDVDLILKRVGGPLPNLLTAFDPNHSGAVLAWKFCHPATRVPHVLQYVEDRDLWRFSLKNSRAVNAFIGSWPSDFDVWSERVEIDFGRNYASDEAIRKGEAVLNQRAKDIDALLDVALRTMVIGGASVPTANVPFFLASDAGNILAEGNPFAATYYDRGDGTRAFSLRSSSEGIDVSEIAQRYGGGGHKHAAGFSKPLGWEGDA